jgi:hypothetical protein
LSLRQKQMDTRSQPGNCGARAVPSERREPLLRTEHKGVTWHCTQKKKFVRVVGLRYGMSVAESFVVAMTMLMTEETI